MCTHKNAKYLSNETCHVDCVLHNFPQVDSFSFLLLMLCDVTNSPCVCVAQLASKWDEPGHHFSRHAAGEASAKVGDVLSHSCVLFISTTSGCHQRRLCMILERARRAFNFFMFPSWTFFIFDSLWAVSWRCHIKNLLAPKKWTKQFWCFLQNEWSKRRWTFPRKVETKIRTRVILIFNILSCLFYFLKLRVACRWSLTLLESWTSSRWIWEISKLSLQC